MLAEHRKTLHSRQFGKASPGAKGKAYAAVKCGLVDTKERRLLYEQAYTERILSTRTLEGENLPRGDE